jgi:hypothetical protein
LEFQFGLESVGGWVRGGEEIFIFFFFPTNFFLVFLAPVFLKIDRALAWRCGQLLLSSSSFSFF